MVVVVGFATGFAQVVQLSPVEGLHTNVPVPTALSVVEFPMQIEASAPAFTGGNGSVVIATKSVSGQLLSVTISVYVVFVVGEATGFEIFGLLKLEEGDQLYVPPPVPLRVVLNPGQTVTSVPAFATGGELICMVTMSVSLHPAEDVTTSV